MKLNKIFKWGMVALIIISVVLLVWGFAVGFEANDGQAVNVLLYWAYFMVGLAVASWVIVGLIVGAKNNPKSLVKIGIVLAGAAVLCAIAFVLAPGSPAMAYNGPEISAGTLKLTDTILNLTYIVGAAAVIAIIVGEVRMSIASKK
ncbi:MAG: hypothetical protein MJY89_06840 [Bacteroidales bacterium]|nr:hypothetical protein [Bacteroidales bacterium]